MPCGSGVESTQFIYLIKSTNSAIEIYSVRAQPHQNPLAADLSAADFREAVP